MTDEAPENLPLGTTDDIKGGRGARERAWVHAGKRYTAMVRPNVWAVEKRAVRECGDASGIDLGKFVDFMLDALIETSSVPLTGPERMGHDPAFVWATARELGILDMAKRLGVSLVGGSARLTVREILSEYLIVEARLRRSGFGAAELDAMPLDEVKELYVVNEADRTTDIERQARVFATVVSERLGL